MSFEYLVGCDPDCSATGAYRDLPLVHDIIEQSEDLTRFTINFQMPSSIINNI